MKKLALTSCLALSALLLSHLMARAGGLASEIEVGDTRAFVIEALGEPEGVVEGGSYEMLKFERGTVELVEGKVTAMDLVSEQEAAARKIARLEAEEERRVAAETKATEQAPDAGKAAEQKPEPAVNKAKAADDKLTPEQQAELDKRIAEGIRQPPFKMSKQKLRRYRRGRSASQLASREGQITEAYMAELKAAGNK